MDCRACNKLQSRLPWGNLESILGATFQDNSYTGLTITGLGFTSDDLIEDLQSAGSISTSGSELGKYRYNAIYGRLGLTIKDRYVLNLTGRRDGSSRFGPDNRFGNFGAIGVAWLFHKEELINKKAPWLSFGKLRASIGVTGNDQFPDYKYLSTYTSSITVYQGIKGLDPKQHTNPDFRWETVNKLEAAVELGLFNNSVNVNINWYRNRTVDQLVGYPLSYITGFNTVQANLPAVVQNAGWEVELNAKLLSKKHFNWSVSGNFSVPKNKLVSYPNLAASGYATRFVIGMPITIVQRYQFKGLNSETGLFTFQDKNGDGVITSAADRHPIFIGQKYFGGITNTLTFNGFELNVLLQYVNQTGSEVGPVTSPGFFFDSQANVPRRYVDRWQNPGDVARYQKVTQVSGSPAATAYTLFRDSDGLISDRSFIRLRNVALSWNMPSRLAKRIGLASFKVFGHGQNLLTLTKFEGVDPEITSSSYALPPLRMITTGVLLTFN